jgi:hypothetical protein
MAPIIEVHIIEGLLMHSTLLKQLIICGDVEEFTIIHDKQPFAPLIIYSLN